MLTTIRRALLLTLICLFVTTSAVVVAGTARAEQSHAPSDELFERLAQNVAAAGRFEVISEIDHSRLAAEAGEEMPPSRVLIFSDPALDAAMMAIDPRLGVDLPLRVLAYEVTPGGESSLLYNDTTYLERRYDLTLPQELKDDYDEALSAALSGIPPGRVGVLTPDGLDGDGLTTLDSPHGFDETLRRIRDAINAQDDTVWFGEVDFDARAQAAGIAIMPAQLLLFGGPGPGGRAMSSAPSLGLDAFCQKLLIVEDANGHVQVIMNDLLALAGRHGVRKSIPLRIINRRLVNTFAEALED